MGALFVYSDSTHLHIVCHRDKKKTVSSKLMDDTVFSMR